MFEVRWHEEEKDDGLSSTSTSTTSPAVVRVLVSLIVLDRPPIAIHERPTSTEPPWIAIRRLSASRERVSVPEL